MVKNSPYRSILEKIYSSDWSFFLLLVEIKRDRERQREWKKNTKQKRSVNMQFEGYSARDVVDLFTSTQTTVDDFDRLNPNSHALVHIPERKHEEKERRKERDQDGEGEGEYGDDCDGQNTFLTALESENGGQFQQDDIQNVKRSFKVSVPSFPISPPRPLSSSKRPQSSQHKKGKEKKDLALVASSPHTSHTKRPESQLSPGGKEEELNGQNLVSPTSSVQSNQSRILDSSFDNEYFDRRENKLILTKDPLYRIGAPRSKVECADLLATQLRTALERLRQDPTMTTVPPVDEALQTGEKLTYLEKLIGEVEKGMLDMQVWNIGMNEVCQNEDLCPSEKLRDVLKYMWNHCYIHMKELDTLLTQVRRRIKHDWLVHTLTKQENVIKTLKRERLNELEKEVEEELQESIELEKSLQHAKVHLEKRENSNIGVVQQTTKHLTEGGEVQFSQLHSGSHVSSRCSSTCQYYTFTVGSDDHGLHLWLSQTPRGTTENYIDITLRHELPPTREEYALKGTTRMKQAVTIKVEDMSLQMAPGTWIIKVQGRGSILKSYDMDLRLEPKIVDVVQPLETMLGEMEAHIGQCESVENQIFKFDGALSSIRKRLVEPPQPIMMTEQATQSSEDFELYEEKLPIVKLFKGDLIPTSALKRIKKKQLLTLLTKLFSEKVLIDKADDRTGKSRIEFDRFVYDYFMNQYDHNRGRAEWKISCLVHTLQQAHQKPPEEMHPRVLEVCRFLHMVPDCLYSLDDLNIYLDFFQLVRKHCASLYYNIRDLRDGCWVPFLVAKSVVKEAFSDVHESWRNEYISKIYTQLSEERDGEQFVDYDQLLYRLFKTQRDMRDLYDERLRQFFAFADMRDNGFLDVESFTSALCGVNPNYTEDEVLRMFIEGVDASGPKERKRERLNLKGLMAIGKKYLFLHERSLESLEKQKQLEAAKGRNILTPSIERRNVRSSSSLSPSSASLPGRSGSDPNGGDGSAAANGNGVSMSLLSASNASRNASGLRGVRPSIIAFSDGGVVLPPINSASLQFRLQNMRNQMKKGKGSTSRNEIMFSRGASHGNLDLSPNGHSPRRSSGRRSGGGAGASSLSFLERLSARNVLGQLSREASEAPLSPPHTADTPEERDTTLKIVTLDGFADVSSSSATGNMTPTSKSNPVSPKRSSGGFKGYTKSVSRSSLRSNTSDA